LGWLDAVDLKRKSGQQEQQNDFFSYHYLFLLKLRITELAYGDLVSKTSFCCLKFLLIAQPFDFLFTHRYDVG